jgi:hypothetical protein
MEVEQCLFGYDDGHRLLASSIPLGTEAATLTELSDLAPGAVFGRSDGYWTGVPAPGITRYVLMRTWLAPEMSRPGCVWTHALLFEPSLLEELRDLSALSPLLVRPSGVYDRERYRGTLTLPFPTGERSAGRTTTAFSLVSALLRSLYGMGDGIVRVDEPGDLDDPLFAVWSQQWPRLRRNFRFQTAATREARPSGGVRFDVTAILGSPSAGPAVQAEANAPWLQAAASDALGLSDGDLRDFLWHYGADVRRQRGSFVPLVKVKLLHDTPQSDAGSRALGIVTKSFASLEDAGQLKQELVNGDLIPTAQLEVLWYVLAQGGDTVFPPPTQAGVSRLALLWPERPGDLLQLAERTADAKDMLSKSVFAAITDAIPTGKFWSLTESYPRVRERMVEARPGLLAAAGALELDNSTIVRMLRFVEHDTSTLAEILPFLMLRDDARLADEAFSLFPRETALEVIAEADGGTRRVGRAWLRELVRRPHILLNASVMGGIQRTSLLYEIAEALGWLTPDVVSAGSDPWMAALAYIESDLPDDRRDILHAFLVALGIATGGYGGRQLLERFFDSVHGQELKARLPWRARDILLPVLAEVSWGRGWDYALRLRLAVAAAYVQNGYPPESYAALSKRRKVRAMLSDAAVDVPGGEPYAKATF